MRNLLRDPSRWSPAQFHLVTASRPATAAVAKGRAAISSSARPGRLQPDAALDARIAFLVPRNGKKLYLQFRENPASKPLVFDLGRSSGRKASAAELVHRRVRPRTEAHDDRAHHRPGRLDCPAGCAPARGRRSCSRSRSPTATGMWMQVMHAVEGGYERSEPPLLLHWLRDSTLSLPLVFTFVWLGLVATRHLVERRGQAQCGPGLAVLTCAAVSALAASFATAIGVPLHAGLFSAHHAGHELGFAEHMARDGLVALAASLPISLLVTSALARRIPWAAPEPRTWRLPVSLSGRVDPADGARPRPGRPRRDLRRHKRAARDRRADPGRPVPGGRPAEGVRRAGHRRRHPDQPVRRPRPAGQMYALIGQIPRSAPRSVAAGRPRSARRPDPAVGHPRQPGRLRRDHAHEQRHRWQVRHAHRRPAVRRRLSGDEVGDKRRSAGAEGARARTSTTSPTTTLEGAHYIRPGPGNRAAVDHGLFGALSVEPAGSV